MKNIFLTSFLNKKTNQLLIHRNHLFVFVAIVVMFGFIATFDLAFFCIPALAKSDYTTYPYAKVESDGVMLYKTNTSLGLQNAYFEIPKSYYVLLIANIDGSFYRAQYRDVVGFVLKSSVVPVVDPPQNPYLEGVTFRVYSTDGTKVFSKTKDVDDSAVLDQVEVMSTINYYGVLGGDEYIENRGSLWYYGKTSDGTFGYFYTGLCDNLSAIIENSEPYTVASDPFFDNDTSYLYSLASMSTGLKVVLIVIITLPTFAIVYLLFRPNRKQKNKVLQRGPHNKKSPKNMLGKIQKVIDDEPL